MAKKVTMDVYKSDWTANLHENRLNQRQVGPTKAGVNVIKKIPSSLMTRTNKLEGLSLETLSSLVRS
jgi:hypothetical protein